MAEVVHSVVVFLTRPFSRRVFGVGRSCRPPPILPEVLVVVGEGVEEVHRGRALAYEVVLVVEAIDWRLARRIVMTRPRAQALNDAIDTSQRIPIRKLQIVDALFGEHTVDRTTIGLSPLLRLPSDEAREHLLLRLS